MREDLESGTQEVDKVHKVPRGATVRLGHAPFIIRQLDEFVYLLVEFGVNLTLCGMTSILKKRNFPKTFSKELLEITATVNK